MNVWNLMLGLILGIVSCDDTLESCENAEVEVMLRTDAALEDRTGMAVWFYCTSADGKSVVIVAEEIADRHYAASLTGNDSPRLRSSRSSRKMPPKAIPLLKPVSSPDSGMSIRLSSPRMDLPRRNGLGNRGQGRR